jgi:hypothetical protein
LHHRGRTLRRAAIPIARLSVSGFPSFARLTRLAWFTRLAQRTLVARHLVEVLVLFEEIRHVEKSVAFQAEIHECRLHPGQNPGDASFMDTAC